MLDILIPTFNRGKYLAKNLDMLVGYIHELNVTENVRIVISNNASSDETNEILNDFSCELIEAYTQEKNIGLENNALFVLEKASARYVMYLGDDDFIDKEYLSGVLSKVAAGDVSLIVPSFYPIDLEGRRIGSAGRGLGKKSRQFEKGKVAVRKLAYLGHQLSGVVYKRDGLYESYRSNQVNSIYLFIYFACVSAMRGKSWLFTDFPVQVTQPPQSKKDWDYGKDGLLEEKFKCFYGAFKTDTAFRAALELQQLSRQGRRLLLYLKGGVGAYFGVFWFLLKSKYVTMPTKLVLFPFALLNPFVQIPSVVSYLVKRANAR